MKRRDWGSLMAMGLVGVLILCPVGVFAAEEIQPPAVEKEKAAPSELDKLKKEWEEVREQQILMIREKEDQLEKLKEEIFAKMKALNAPVVPGPVEAKASVAVPPQAILPVDASGASVLADRSEFEAQKIALQVERQKFFSEMNRQKEKLRELQEITKQQQKALEEERARFEQEKKSAVR